MCTRGGGYVCGGRECARAVVGMLGECECVREVLVCGMNVRGVRYVG